MNSLRIIEDLKADVGTTAQHALDMSWASLALCTDMVSFVAGQLMAGKTPLEKMSLIMGLYFWMENCEVSTTINAFPPMKHQEECQGLSLSTSMFSPPQGWRDAAGDRILVSSGQNPSDWQELWLRRRDATGNCFVRAASPEAARYDINHIKPPKDMRARIQAALNAWIATPTAPIFVAEFAGRRSSSAEAKRLSADITSIMVSDYANSRHPASTARPIRGQMSCEQSWLDLGVLLKTNTGVEWAPTSRLDLLIYPPSPSLVARRSAAMMAHETPLVSIPRPSRHRL